MTTRDQQSALRGAHDAEPKADADPDKGQMLQDQIGQALQPAMAVLRDQITATVGREIQHKLQQPGRTGQSRSGRSGEQPPDAQSDVARRESSNDDFDRNETAGSRLTSHPELGQALREQIGRALQPAMAEFREQTAASVRHELDETIRRDRPQTATGAGRSPSRASDDDESSSDQGDREPADHASAQDTDTSEGPAGRDIRSALGKPLLQALPVILEQQGEQWLRTQLDQGIDLLFSIWVRAAVQQEVERALHRVTRVGINLVPDRATRDDLRAHSEKTVEHVVQTALERLFADDVRDDLKARGHQAVGALFHPDVKSIMQQGQEMLLSLLEGLIAVVRECWDQILQFLTRVVLALVQPRLTGILKDTLSSLATTSGREREKQDAPSSQAADEGDAAPRRDRRDHADDASADDDRARDRSRQRSRDDAEESGDRSSTGGDRRPGRAPSGRPSTGRSSSTRQTSGRSSSDRSTSGRSSRAASR